MGKKRSIFLLLILIFVFIAIIFWRFYNFKLHLSEISQKNFDLPKLKFPSLTETLSENEKINKEFITPDKKLKFNYPADWSEMNGLFGKISPQFFFPNPDNKMKFLFIATKINPQKFYPAYLLCQETSLNDPEKILAEITNTTTTNMEILNLEKRENLTIFEIKIQGASSFPLFYGKEIIITLPEKSFLVSVFTLMENWQEISAEATDIINSVEILDQINSDDKIEKEKENE